MFINRLDDIISYTIPVLSSQFNSKLIIASSNKKGSSFFNNLFNDNENNFIKNNLHWSIDEENIKNMKNINSLWILKHLKLRWIWRTHQK
jgi:hypothetical protein